MATNQQRDGNVRKEREEFRMRKFKKSLAFALAAAMVVTAMPATAQAAPTAKAGTSTLYANGITAYSKTKITGTKGYSIRCLTKNTKLLSVGKYGTVKAKTAGKARTGAAVATVTVKMYKNSKKVATKNVKINVKPAAYAVSVSVDKTSLNLGETAQATGKKATAKAAGTLRYYSSNASVATVNSKTGVITPVASGSTNITAKSTISRKTSTAVAVTVVADAPAATQSGAKTITITNGVSMADRAVTIKRGTASVALSTAGITFSSDGKTVIINTSNKLTDGEYTVTVADKTLTVKATTEKVTNINILSTKAAANTNNSPTKATAAYQVLNQFGEDVTKTETVKVSGTDLAQQDIATGIITFERTTTTGASVTPYIIDRDIVTVVIIHTETGVSAQATLTVSNQAAVDSITYAGVYNGDGKTLNEDSDPTEFYLLFTLKDQYNGVFKNNEDVIIGEDLLVTVAGGLTNLQTQLNTSSKQTAKKITKDGVAYVGVKLAKVAGETVRVSAGTAQLSAISMGTGKGISDSFTVAAGGKVSSLSITAPSDLVGNEDYEFDFTALDSEGNAVVKYDQLKNVTIGNNGSVTGGKVSWKKDSSTSNGKLVFTATAGVATSTPSTLTFTTVDYKTTIFSFTVKADAVPKKITAVKTLAATAGQSTDIKFGNLTVQDQHGRTITDAEKVRNILKGYTLQLVLASDADFTVSAIASSTSITPTATLVSYKVTGSESVSATKLFTITTKSNVSNEASTTVTLSIYNAATALVSGSELKTTMTGSSVAKLTSVKATVDKVYAGGANFAREVVVTGTRSGETMTIPASEYVVYMDSSDVDVASNSVSVNGASGNISALKSSDEATFTGTVKFISADLDDINFSVVVSKVAPTIKSIKYADDAYKIPTGGTINVAYLFDSTYVEAIVDTYGYNHKPGGTNSAVDASGTFTVPRWDTTPASYKPQILIQNISSTPAISASNNGTNTAALTITAGFVSAGVTITYSGYNVTKTVTAR